MTLNLDISQIQRKRNQFCWLFLSCLLIGCISITCAYVALQYAKNEKADISVRDVRFNLAEIESPQYHFWRIWANVCSTGGKLLLTPITLVVYIQYLLSLGYSYRRTTLYFFATLLLPIINLFILLHVLRLGGKYITDLQTQQVYS
ncbi:MAG: hypothetical protein LBC20_03515 [Planctomycetaceae bacterium]|jgi:hypothetical protein|nr:hypothetical protein [Planctomycetaceae bacterium]